MIVSQALSDAIEKYLRGEASPEETALVNEWYDAFNDTTVIVNDSTTTKEETDQRMRSVLSRLAMQDAPVAKVYPMKRWVAAASIALLVAAGAIYLINRKAVKPAPVMARQSSLPVIPGSNKAMLILDDGSAVTLDETATQQVLRQQGTDINVQQQSLVYNNAGTPASAEVAYNTLKTPRGGQFELVLPDGTKVWLNAASSLKYPVAFNGKDRKVILSGEAYFEVAQNQQQPFIVQLPRMQVQVLGTHFNVTAYADEMNVRTTLLQGAVKVNNEKNNQLLKPGQQAVLADDATDFIVKETDVSSAIAWKEGKFHFAGEEISVTLRQIARWYDLNLRYENGEPKGHLSAELPRTTSLENVLKMLDGSGIHCHVSNHDLIVSGN
jgi:ferric-dicitrate binding protein FerR (iron transport regulator)